MKLQKTKNDFIKFINDLQPGKNSESQSHAVKVFSMGDYISNDLLLFHDLSYASAMKSSTYPENISG